MSQQETVTKKFGKGERQIPKEKARKYYPAEDESKPKKVWKPTSIIGAYNPESHGSKDRLPLEGSSQLA